MRILPEFQQHPDRARLHGEIHARPPEAQVAPLEIAHVAMLADGREREASRRHLERLLRRHHLADPGLDATHLRVDIGALRIRWELHTEFVTWTFSRAMPSADTVGHRPAPGSAFDDLPRDWLSGLPGRCLCSLELWVLDDCEPQPSSLPEHVLRADSLVGAVVAKGGAKVLTDFCIHPGGSTRMILQPAAMSPRRLGRLIQRLLEIETYRMVALLGLPVAREASAAMSQAEEELAGLATAIASARPESEPALLDQLTRLAGRIEGLHAATQSRLSASAAYFELMDQRLRQIAETPLEGFQTLSEFIERRLTPARKTCEWATRRQDAISQRLSRMSDLLRTRVEIDQQRGVQDLLSALNQRQDVQLKLQSTVEGLSVAAITYYIVGLVTYGAKGLQKLGSPLSPELAAAVSIPVVGSLVWLSLRRMHRSMFGTA